MHEGKVGIIVNRFPVPSETFIVTKLLGMIAGGLEVEVFCASASKDWNNFAVLDESQRKKIRITHSILAARRSKWSFFPKLGGYFLTQFCRYPGPFLRLLRIVRSQATLDGVSWLPQFAYKLMFLGKRPDILHVEFDFQAYGLLDLKDFLGCKLVLSGRGSIERTSIPSRFPRFYPYIYSKVDYYHFISKYLLQEAYAKGLDKKIPVYLIEPAIDLSLFRPGKRIKSPGKIKLITIARLSWAKGHEFGMDAVARVWQKHPDIEYTLIGEGDYKEAIQYAAYQHGLLANGVVRFAGNIKREEIRAYLEEADIMVHPALEEGFCNAVIEAQAMEVPVVCSDAGGLPENVENGVTGFVVPRRNARIMAEKILLLIENPDMRAKMGAAGRTRALERFDLEKQTESFRNMYTDILHEHA